MNCIAASSIELFFSVPIIANFLKKREVLLFIFTKKVRTGVLTNLEITNQTYQYPDNYSIEQSYRYCFGIISPNDEEPQDIILSFDPFQGKYIKTLPLHDTQQVLVDNDEEMKIKLKLCLTHDLVMELLSFGDNMKVIEPKSLADQIKQAHEKAYRQY